MLWRSHHDKPFPATNQNIPITRIMSIIAANAPTGLIVKNDELITTSGKDEILCRVWKTIKIGSVRANDLRSRIKRRNGLGHEQEAGHDIMNQKGFGTLDIEENVDLVKLNHLDLGLTAENFRTHKFMTPEFCAEWSARHLKGYVLELCPAEVGPHLREQYEDQPIGEVVYIAMESVVDSSGKPALFHLECNHDGSRRLHVDRAIVPKDLSYQVYDPGTLVVFRQRRVGRIGSMDVRTAIG